MKERYVRIQKKLFKLAKKQKVAPTRCSKWNVDCDFASNLQKDPSQDCVLDNTITCNENVLRARHRFLESRRNSLSKKHGNL